jgi:hypothetical protein
VEIFGSALDSLSCIRCMSPSGGAEPKEQEASALPETAAKAEPKKERTPRLDWAGLLRRTFVLDIFACGGCGGRRRVLA